MANPPVATRPNPTPATLSTSSRKFAPSATQKSSAQPPRNSHSTDNTSKTANHPRSKATSQTHTTQDHTEEQREDLRRKKYEEFSKEVENEWKGIGKSGCKLVVLAPFSKAGMAFHSNISMTVDVTVAINDGIQDEIDQQRRDAKAARLANRRRNPRIEHDETEDSKDEQLTEKEKIQKLKNIQAYKQLLQLYPCIDQRLQECSDYKDVICQSILVRTIHKGASECARNDRKTLKKEVPNMIPVVVEKALLALSKDTTQYEFPRITNSVLKSERGINDPQMAMLLMSWQHGHRFWIDSRSMSDVDIIMDDIKGGTIPPMTSDTLPSFLFDWTKWKADQSLSGNLLGPLDIAAYKCIMTSPSSALEPKIQATRRGNAKIRGIKSVNMTDRFLFSASFLVVSPSIIPQERYDGKFHSDKFYEWMVKWIDDAPAKWREKTFKKLNMDIFDVEDDEDDDEPSLDSDLVLLQQHMKDYVDSDDEQDIPPTSNSSASNRSSPNTNVNGIQDDRSLSALPPGAMNTPSAEIQDDDDFYEDPAGNAQDEEEEAPVRYHPPKLSRHRGNVPIRRAREDNEIDSNDGRASKRKKQ
ncbi:hypothetical protein C8R42DRAFT_719698 [Lentinula raphanica]|nr:hypothetical protein C8R42DRAFT_719698 [Lentinula raphanica]